MGKYLRGAVCVVALIGGAGEAEAVVKSGWSAAELALGVVHWHNTTARGGESHLMCIDGQSGIAVWEVVGETSGRTFVTFDAQGCMAPPTWFDDDSSRSTR